MPSFVLFLTNADKMLLILAVLFALPASCTGNSMKQDNYIEACADNVYCKGSILHKVQMSKAFGDAKTFVDMPMRNEPGKILQPFMQQLNMSKGAKEIKTIVEKYFSQAGTELTNVKPLDWKETPAVLAKISDLNLRKWAEDINNRWKILTRKMKDDVKTRPSRYSLIYSKNPFVVPGGRFREFYYWDTYWVVHGLLLSDMTATVKGMLENFIELVKTYGLVPNGGRIYYLNRSQPPFLSLMVYEYWKKTNDTAFLLKALPHLEKEYEFWMRNRTVQVDKSHGFKASYTLNRYATPMGYPRPESYWNDVETMEKTGMKNESEKKALYAHIASAAESGWDFSSRWFRYSGKQSMTMMSIKTRDIIPVDLNAILCKVENSLTKLFNVTGDSSKQRRYEQAFQNRVKTINDVFWNEKHKQWLDFDIQEKKHRSPFYVSNISPIWAACYGNMTRANEAINSVKRQGVLNYPGGVPTSLNKTEEQWDFPNAWPPLQDIMETSLRISGNNDLAFNLAKKWIETNYLSWKETGHMYEKYDVNIRGKPGHGGEYGVQVGFGWTNGVVLQLLHRYGDRLKAPKYEPNSGTDNSMSCFHILFMLVMPYLVKVLVS